MGERFFNRHCTEGFAIYNCTDRTFFYSDSLKNMFSAQFDNRMFWKIISEDGVVSEITAKRLRRTINRIERCSEQFIKYTSCYAKSREGTYVQYHVGFIYTHPGKEITITIAMDKRIFRINKDDRDELTGLLSHKTFTHNLRQLTVGLTDAETGTYLVVYLDIQRFKFINEMFGTSEGDELLKHIAKVIKSVGSGCRIGSDRFVYFAQVKDKRFNEHLENVIHKIETYSYTYETTCNAGAYVIVNRKLPVDSIINFAIMAQASVKGSYAKKYAYYDDIMMNTLISEQKVVGMMRTALNEEQFVVYYQPQYNHSTGMLVGTEALIRWQHPEQGLLYPGQFIPVFEKTGFITKLDLYVFYKVCCFIRKCLTNNYYIVPISVNLTRYDIFSPDFIEHIEEIRKKYDIETKYIRFEITESAAIGNGILINNAVEQFHKLGYKVEMDDFGSGYSSLNILKDIDFDVIKLDMKFLDVSADTERRGGTILSYIVKMINWLELPVIAEGVETAEQADYLRSIGCEYIQGYLYSKPVPEVQYIQFINKNNVGTMIPQLNLIDKLSAADLWSPQSMDTLVFNQLVGGAAIFSYDGKSIEILRVNRKYIEEYGMNCSQQNVITSDPSVQLSDDDKNTYRNMLETAIETGQEQECETWRTVVSECCGKDTICIRSTVRVIGTSKNSTLFYAMVRNITAEKTRFHELSDLEHRFQIASEQVNVYYWQYTIATKEMRPCFRCMRDLGLPALMTNYPESAIQAGVFPSEFADMYRDWHRQIEAGVPELEAVIPLTAERIPFRVKYTTEYDEVGHPVKAYGSATLVV